MAQEHEWTERQLIVNIQSSRGVSEIPAGAPKIIWLAKTKIWTATCGWMGGFKIVSSEGQAESVPESYKARRGQVLGKAHGGSLTWEAKSKPMDQLEEGWMPWLSEKHQILLDLSDYLPKPIISAEQTTPLARALGSDLWRDIVSTVWGMDFSWLSFDPIVFWYFGDET